MKTVLVCVLLLFVCSPSWAERVLVIDTTFQTFILHENGDMVRKGVVSTGKKGFETPKGTFQILEKTRFRRSSITGTPMLYSLRFKNGCFIHLGNALGRQASHGCVRLNPEDSLAVFRKMAVGDTIVVQ